MKFKNKRGDHTIHPQWSKEKIARKYSRGRLEIEVMPEKENTYHYRCCICGDKLNPLKGKHYVLDYGSMFCIPCHQVPPGE